MNSKEQKSKDEIEVDHFFEIRKLKSQRKWFVIGGIMIGIGAHGLIQIAIEHLN